MRKNGQATSNRERNFQLYQTLCALPVDDLIKLCESFEYWNHVVIKTRYAQRIMRWCKHQGQLDHLEAVARLELHRIMGRNWMKGFGAW